MFGLYGGQGLALDLAKDLPPGASTPKLSCLYVSPHFNIGVLSSLHEYKVNLGSIQHLVIKDCVDTTEEIEEFGNLVRNAPNLLSVSYCLLCGLYFVDNTKATRMDLHALGEALQTGPAIKRIDIRMYHALQ